MSRLVSLCFVVLLILCGKCTNPCATAKCKLGRGCVNDIDSDGNVFANCCGNRDEWYDTCGTLCPPTCANPGPIACAKPCNAACYCKPGLIRQYPMGPCVHPKKCVP
mmetsp:Transcript_78472/g.96015  ORF Transcript_78472/g.96015 Transcript_78472/m.96015 type:complete len:107 (+) Transcript_78472:87-407(+)